ncbi:response regulator transcription factor [Nonomuraea sp. NPDC049504]|uniref:response regulator transcription factor n=1 Tax=Nonomuraea sp. NPDC049504 TaxID=3154729 RepID=UPI00341A4129
MIRVVVADDQAVVREGLVLLLGLLPGIDVVGSAGDGEAALRLVETERPDVVLMDLRMPRMDGVEATRRVRAAHPGTQVVVLTTYSDDESVFAALRAGARGFLTKDAEADDIAKALATVMRGDAQLDPTVQRRLLDSMSPPGPPSPALPPATTTPFSTSPPTTGRPAVPSSTTAPPAEPLPSPPGEAPPPGGAASAAPPSPTGASESRRQQHSGERRVRRSGESLPDGLTPREGEVLMLIADGLSNAEIAARLFITEATVKTHINNLFAKAGLRDRAQAVTYAYRHGLVTPG